jgi:two-component sensor histidine kinase
VLDLIHIKTNRHAWGQCGRDAIVQPPLEQGEVMMRLEPSEPTGPLSPIPILGSLSPCADCGVAKEADHRIANHLAMLAGYVSVKASAMQEDPALISRRDAALMLQAVRSQIELIARVHRAMIFDDGAAPDLSRHIHEACQPFQNTLSPTVLLVEDLPAHCLVTAKQLLPLTQIVAEALINAIKHAHPAGQAGKIVVRCRRDAGGLRVEVADDGVGLPLGYDPKDKGGYGARLIERLARQIGAVLSFEAPGGGHCVAVTLP